MDSIEIYFVFSESYCIFMYFKSLLDFLKILKWNRNKKGKAPEQRWVSFRPKALASWCSPAANSAWPARPPCAGMGAQSAVTTPSPRARQLGGAPAVGALVAEAARHQQMEYRCRASDSSGKVWWTGSHRSGATPERRRMRASMAVFPVPATVPVVLIDSDGLL
jgi:hypothetical protein